MTLEKACIIIPMICYSIASLKFALSGNWGMALAWGCYAGANVGFAIALKA